MKPLSILILLLAVSFISYGQTVFSFKEIPKDSLDIIEGKFISAFDALEGFVCAFPEGGETVIEHWSDLHTSFQRYLKEKGFEFQSDTKMFLRFYFTNAGDVAYAGYNIKTPFTTEQIREFTDHLTSFSRTYNFGLQAEQAYVQCGTVMYKQSTLTK
jgi:hypothetical protein